VDTTSTNDLWRTENDFFKVVGPHRWHQLWLVGRKETMLFAMDGNMVVY